MDRVSLGLDGPPLVANIGVGLHGVTGLRDVFLLPELWQLHLYGYAGELVVGGTMHSIRPGRVSLIPPATQAAFHYRGRSEHLFVHFRPAGSAAPRSVPVMQDAGAETPLLSGLLRRALAARPGTPGQVSAEVWTALWRVARLADIGGAGSPHSAVAAAMAHIEANLAGPLNVADVARIGGVSHNHLTRLFRAETGDTVVAYIRRRRLERAGHLLRESTLSIPAIAASVGIGDLQAFNKACHRELGDAPRAVRAAAPVMASRPLAAGNGTVSR